MLQGAPVVRYNDLPPLHAVAFSIHPTINRTTAKILTTERVAELHLKKSARQSTGARR